MTAPARYTLAAISLHWLVAFLILAAFPLGLYMSDLALSPLKLKLISYHKWLGVTVFLLAAARLAWRATNTPPPLPADMPAWKRYAESGHIIPMRTFWCSACMQMRPWCSERWRWVQRDI